MWTVEGGRESRGGGRRARCQSRPALAQVILESVAGRAGMGFAFWLRDLRTLVSGLAEISLGCAVCSRETSGQSDITVTIAAQATCAFGLASSAHDITKSVAAGAQVEFPACDPKLFNDANGKVQITYSAVTSLTVAVVVAGQF